MLGLDEVGAAEICAVIGTAVLGLTLLSTVFTRLFMVFGELTCDLYVSV